MLDAVLGSDVVVSLFAAVRRGEQPRRWCLFTSSNPADDEEIEDRDKQSSDSLYMPSLDEDEDGLGVAATTQLVFSQ